MNIWECEEGKVYHYKRSNNAFLIVKITDEQICTQSVSTGAIFLTDVSLAKKMPAHGVGWVEYKKPRVFYRIEDQLGEFTVGVYLYEPAVKTGQRVVKFVEELS